MARPRAKELTERELEIMHVFWDRGEISAHEVRDQLADVGRELAYTTVATLIKILVDKGFLVQTCDTRPFTYKTAKTFDEVSGNLVTDLISRVFGGSRKELLVRLIDQKRLTKSERQFLEKILEEKK